MFIVGRIIRVVDSRIILAAGFAIAACSLWQMTGFYLQMDVWSLFWSGILQGLGTGILYVPLASMAFGTLSPALRDEGTTLFSLIRNIGSSVGISVVITLLTRNGQIMHARLAEKFTPYIDPWHPGLVSTVRGMAALNGSITRQAQMIAYIDDFKLMMVLSIAAIPLVFLLRKPKAQRVDEPVVIE
jgi:DHA2 family multidrug resistance protein